MTEAEFNKLKRWEKSPAKKLYAEAVRARQAVGPVLVAGELQHKALISCTMFLLGTGPQPDPQDLADAQIAWSAASSAAVPR